LQITINTRELNFDTYTGVKFLFDPVNPLYPLEYHQPFNLLSFSHSNCPPFPIGRVLDRFPSTEFRLLTLSAVEFIPHFLLTPLCLTISLVACLSLSLISHLLVIFFPISDESMELINFALMCTYFVGSMLLGIVALNSPQAYRPALLAGLIACAVLSFRQISDGSFGVWGCEIFAMFVIIYISHISCVLCVEKYVLPKKPGVTFDWAGDTRCCLTLGGLVLVDKHPMSSLLNARLLVTQKMSNDEKNLLGIH
jgi:hypothetical protein